jgi:hypothetical protein
LSQKQDYKLDWAALLETADDIISKGEQFVGDKGVPMLEIDKVRGVEHAYYEALMEETDKILKEVEGALTPNQKVTPTEPIEVSRERPLSRRVLSK